MALPDTGQAAAGGATAVVFICIARDWIRIASVQLHLQLPHLRMSNHVDAVVHHLQDGAQHGLSATVLFVRYQRFPSDSSALERQQPVSCKCLCCGPVRRCRVCRQPRFTRPCRACLQPCTTRPRGRRKQSRGLTRTRWVGHAVGERSVDSSLCVAAARCARTDAGARKLVASTLAQHKQRTKCTRTRSKATLPTHVAHSHLRLHLLIRLRSNVIALRVARLSPCSPRGTCTPTVPVARGAACAHIDRASTPSARRC